MVIPPGLFAGPTSILIALLILAVVLLVGRVLLELAWRIVLVAIAVAVGLWTLGVLGVGVGFL